MSKAACQNGGMKIIKEEQSGRNPNVITEKRKAEDPKTEQQFLETLMQFMHSARGSQDQAVAATARQWESRIAFRIRVTMQNPKRPGLLRGARWKS